MTNAVLVTASCQHLEHFHFPDYTGQTLAYLQLGRKFVSMGKEGKCTSFPVAHFMCHFMCPFFPSTTDSYATYNLETQPPQSFLCNFKTVA